MKIQRSPGLHPALMFIAPSLNVVLLLVFYIILSTSFLLQPGVTVEVPQSPFLLAPQRNPLINDAVTFEELRHKLKEYGGRNHTVIIKTDRRSPVEQLTKVMTVSLSLGYPTVIATSEAQ